MEKVVTFLYRFNELSEEAKAHAVETIPTEWMVDYDWWEYVYRNYKEKLEKIGLTGDFSFSGFWSQGDGAGISELKLVNMKGLVKALGIQFPHKALEKLFYDFVSFSNHRNFWYRNFADSDSEFVFEGLYMKDAPRIETFLDNACEIATEKLDEFLDQLRCDLYHDLEAEYEYRTSDEEKAEVAESMGWKFEEDGTFHSVA